MIWRLSLAFLLSLVIGLVAYAPVGKLLPRLLPADLGISFYELEGSLLNGRAGYVSYQQLGARKLLWHIRPLALLGLRLAADIEVSLDSRDPRQDNSWLTGSVSAALLSDSLRVSNLEAVAPLAALQSPLKLAFMPMSGNLYLSIRELELAGMKPLRAEGRARLLDAQFLVGRPAALGSYQADIVTENDVIQARAQDEDSGTVDLEAQADLNPDGSYRLSAKLKPKLNTPAPIANSMKALGRTDRQGWYQVNRQGALPRP